MTRHTIFHCIFFFILIGYLSIGLGIFRDYGVSIDEYSQIDLGRVNYERITKGSLEIQTHFDRYYGPVFEMPLYVFSHFIAGPTFGIDEMSARRLGMFLFFSIALIGFYRFLSTINNHPAYGLIGVVLLLCSPRIFAESFYNTKDIAFLSAVIFVLWALARMRTFDWRNIVLLSLATGFAMAMRAQGLLILGVTMMTLMVYGKERLVRRGVASLFYGVGAVLAAYLMFPVFWNDPIKNIVGFWHSSSNPLGVPTYYFGKILISPNTPWHYHFVWVAITSLVSVLVTFLFGIVWFGLHLLRTRYVFVTHHRVLLAMGGIIIGTFMTSVFFHPRSYDGWRHIYYIYPCMIGFSVYAIKSYFEYRNARLFMALLVVVGVFMVADVFETTRFMIANHPNQYVYFNALAGGYRKAKANFDFDYWGISYKQLYAYLRELSVEKFPRVYFEQPLPYVEKIMIPSLKKSGFVIVSSADTADVYVRISRDIKESPPTSFYRAYSVEVEGVQISGVYLRKK